MEGPNHRRQALWSYRDTSKRFKEARVDLNPMQPRLLGTVVHRKEEGSDVPGNSNIAKRIKKDGCIANTSPYSSHPPIDL
jgi:hypothetical protein